MEEQRMNVIYSEDGEDFCDVVWFKNVNGPQYIVRQFTIDDGPRQVSNDQYFWSYKGAMSYARWIMS